MTLYFPNDFYPTVGGGFCIDGDLSGDSPFHTNTPQGWAQMRLQLISRYTNRSVDNESTEDRDVIDIHIRDVNERYTEFGFTFSGTNDLDQKFASGLYDYKIWATYMDLVDLTQPFDPEQWSMIHEGECKVKTKTTRDMNRGAEAQTIKYTTEPNTAESYVIYRD